MITDDPDMDVHGDMTSPGAISRDRPNSPDGSRSPTRPPRETQYPTTESSAPAAYTNGFPQEGQEKLASSVVDQMRKLMNHLETRIQMDRLQIQQEQALANQTMVEQLIRMQQESNAIRTESLILRQDLQCAFESMNTRQQELQVEMANMQKQSGQTKSENPDATMPDAHTTSRKNLMRREYRTTIPVSPRTPSAPSHGREYVLYDRPGNVPVGTETAEHSRRIPLGHGSSM